MNYLWYWLMGWGYLIDGFVRILSFAVIRPHLAYYIVMRKLHYEMKQRENNEPTE